MVWLRLNHTLAPFDNPKVRQALLHLVNQKENLDAAGIRASEQVPYCPAYFLCGTPLESAAGAQGLKAADVAKARALLAEGGYAGQKVVFLNAADSPINNAVTLTMAEAMRKGGINVDVATMDWATLTQRRNKKEPADQGGWHLFVTVANVLDGGSPLTNLYLASPCQGGLAGWPCDQKLEDLRRSWWEEGDPAKRRGILDAVHAQAYQSVPYVNAGQFRTLAAYRSNVEGLRATTIPVFWGVEKK
jgi:peptide/nickel transport system substrate-binding protein